MTDETIRQVIEEAARKAVVAVSEDRVAVLIDSAVEAAYERYFSRPPCGLSADAASELSHMMGMVRDVGCKGSYADGIEVLRHNALFIRRLRSGCERVGALAIGFVVMTTCGWILLVTSSGFRAWLKEAVSK